MISDIISIINLVAIVILFILFFTKNNKENFTGVPSGYTNLLVSDPDGNLDTFSIATLESDIDKKISAALTAYTTTSELEAYLRAYTTTSELEAKYQPKGNYQWAGNYQRAGNYALKTDLDNYVKRNTSYSIKMGTGNAANPSENRYMVGSHNNWTVAFNGDSSAKWSFV